MAVFAFTNPNITLNSVDISAMVKSATLEIEAEDLETTAFGATFKSRIGGLKSGSLSLTFNQDFAASQVDATLWPLLGTVTAFQIKAVNAVNSATNPQYSGSVLVSQYSPFGNSVGELAEVSVQFPTSGTISRATS